MQTVNNCLNNKKISIFGMSKMGIAAARLAQKSGAHVFISEIQDLPGNNSDIKLLKEFGIESEVGKNTEKILDADLIIKSPGVSPNHPILLKGIEKEIPITGEIDFAMSFFNGNSKFISVTGTNGKTISTLLLCHILKLAGIKYCLTGHRNTPISEIIYQDLNPEYIVQEVSCSDLRDNSLIKPDIAVLLNIYPDHLDLFGRFEKYAETKFSLLRNLKTDAAVFINDTVKQLADECHCPVYPCSLLQKCHSRESGNPGFNQQTISQILDTIPDYFRGYEEILSAVYMVCRSIGIDNNIILKGIETFNPPPHRRQIIHLKNTNITIINDAKGTNIQALKSSLVWASKPVILIAGGKDKGQDFSILENIFKQQVKKLIAVGSTGKKLIKLADTCNVSCLDCTNDGLKNAVIQAVNIAGENDMILYSPAGSHEDPDFKNAEEAGNWMMGYFQYHEH